METFYFDKAGQDGCYSIYIKGAEVIPAGTTMYIMPVKDKNREYQRYADEYDIHFIFEDCVPAIDFYTVPQVDIMAMDSSGGFFGTVGHISELTCDAPICYIDKDQNCFLAADNFLDFLEKAADWKGHLRPYQDVAFYRSLDEAKRERNFLELHQCCCHPQTTEAQVEDMQKPEGQTADRKEADVRAAEEQTVQPGKDEDTH